MTSLTGQSYIGGEWRQPEGSRFESYDPRLGTALATYAGCGKAEIDLALSRASDAHAAYRARDRSEVARFLCAIADEIEVLGDELLQLADRESGLGLSRIASERERTCGQFRAFAEIVEQGHWVQASIDTALPDRRPTPRPDLRRMLRPIGPVVVFGASNFPLAFGTLGGDTASALAAGNAVVVKGHPSHPATSELLTHALAKAAAVSRMPNGVFSMLQGSDTELGALLVCHPGSQAVGFTGSLAGGRALMDLAARRPQPIPVYAEMGSVNPVFICGTALAERATAIAAALADSACMGTGQFCTSPGVVVTLANETFANALQAAFGGKPRGTMLNARIAASFAAGIAAMSACDGVTRLCGDAGPDRGPGYSAAPFLFRTSAARFLAEPDLAKEVFGPVVLLVECDESAQLAQLARSLPGNLTATVHGGDTDPQAAELLAILETKAGRVLFNGFPTGVEVCPSMQHGGPYPAASMASSTSVGADAIVRFARFVAWQNVPEALLPAALRNSNPHGIQRRINGEYGRHAIKP